MEMPQNILYLGDALKLLISLDNCSIDCILTDPPYKNISGGRDRGQTGHPKGILADNDGKRFRHNDVQITDYINEFYRVLKDGSHIYIMVNVLNLEIFLSEIKRVGFKIHNVLVWHKNNVTPNKWYLKNGEFTILAYKGSAKKINNMDSKMVHSFKNPTSKLHPTQKPVKLMELYIRNSTEKGDIVLDPFAGSGTTIIAAQNLDRKFIGIEIDEEFYQIASERIEKNAARLLARGRKTFIRTKKVNGHEYQYEVFNYRENGKVKQKIVGYIGKVEPK